MSHAQSYENLFATLQQMKEEILKQVKPLEEQIVHASVAEQRNNFEANSEKLSRCLDDLDRHIFICQKHVNEYAGVRSALHEINERIARFGADRLPVTDSLPSLDLAEFLRQRIDYLRSQGKI